MSEFKLDKKKLPAIASELGVELKELEPFFTVFGEFYETVRLQHLASVMRALELRIRKKNPQSPSFKIVWKQSGGPQGDTTSKAGVGLKWTDKYGIAIPPGLDLKQLRVYIAHELGHLFYLYEHPETANDRDLHQKMANVFGVFTMLERNEFYLEKAPTMTHARWMQVVKDFKQLSNREQGKYNVS